jgi:RNA polymerase sigma-70 factor, ECF subfamily
VRTRRASSLLSDADTALQRAKDRGGGIYELFDETVRARLIERLELEQALRQAVDADELRTLYQPIVSLKEGRLVGVEALVRWDRPGRGQLLPAEFVPFAEETGLIVPLGAWVLAESCRQAARWRANGPRTLPPTVHVNLSPRQFAEPHLIDLVAGALADTGTDPDRLCLEVTERALAANPASGRHHPQAPVRPRRPRLGRRLRDRLLVPGLAAVPAAVLAQDRPLVRGPPRPRPPPTTPWSPPSSASARPLSPRASRPPASWPSSTSSAATTPRATCSPAPTPPPGSASSSATTAAGSSRLRGRNPGAPDGVWMGETESVEGRPLDEQELVEQARGGDARAYEALVRRYQDLAFRTAFVIAGGSADAEDAAQEGFVKAWYALPRFRAGSPFRPWLLAIVANEARNRRRSGRRQDDLAVRVAEDRPSGDAAPSPEAAALATEQRRLLLAAMGRLGETDRQVIACRYFLELSEAEMAAALGCRPGTVKSRLSRALDRLRAVLAEPGGALAAAPDAGPQGGDR